MQWVDKEKETIQLHFLVEKVLEIKMKKLSQENNAYNEDMS